MAEIRGLRMTFEDVLDNQELLRSKLDSLIEDNRSLKKHERKEYFRLVARSTLGVTSHGTGREIEFTVKKHGIHMLGNVEKIARWMGYVTDKSVELPVHPHIKVEIRELWQLLRDYFFDIWPRAQYEAIKISPEREHGRTLGGPGTPKR